jgi:hypothetical protein
MFEIEMAFSKDILFFMSSINERIIKCRVRTKVK